MKDIVIHKANVEVLTLLKRDLRVVFEGGLKRVTKARYAKQDRFMALVEPKIDTSRLSKEVQTKLVIRVTTLITLTAWAMI
jgi:hypothetical protein